MGDRKRSERITPDMIDEAVLVIVVRPDGSFAVDSDNGDPMVVANVLHGMSHTIADGKVVALDDDAIDNIERFANGEPNG